MAPAPKPLQPAWDTEGLRQALAPRLPGLRVEWRATVDSTNTRLVEQARGQVGRRSADLAPCLLVAEAQTAGRGRMGRRWASTPGRSLTFSLSLPLAPVAWGGLSLVVGVALAEALDPPAAPGAAPRIGLKWPNDLWLLDAEAANGVGRKLGGVLVETVAVGPQRMVVVGIGLNIAAPAAEPGMAAPEHGLGTLGELEPGLGAPAALARVAPPLVGALQRFEREGWAPFAPAWAGRDLLAGRPLTLHGSSRAVQGDGAGVDTDGALLLRCAGDAIERIVSGEVSVRLAATA